MMHLALCLLLTSAPQQEDAAATAEDRAAEERRTTLRDQARSAGELIGIELTDPELELLTDDVAGNRESYRRLRDFELENGDAPALVFDPALLLDAARLDGPAPRELPFELPAVERPADLEDLAFADLLTLASLVRSRQVTCLELAELFLARLERLDETLFCVVTLTPERARERAALLDAELERGEWRGLLHGIPWGAKDLLSVRGYPTTWGAMPYREQVLDADAAVVRRLDEAGAVLVAKLTLGALAWGDVWFGGRTRNPWSPEQGSSGSSAGSASAVAAGGVPFAIGSETLGSIVSPSDRCGCSSLRPSFGRVSRAGAMALSWSMDKLGPLCRSATDAAIVFAAIEGADPADPGTRHGSLSFAATPSVEGLSVGILVDAYEENEAYAAVVDQLEALGARAVPITVPDYPVGDMTFVLNAEAATAFDELTRDGRDELLVRQERRAWPNVFRASRLVPAVEYLRANRLRVRLLHALEETLRQVDVLCHPSFAGGLLTATNLTGHPAVVVPCGFRENGTPFSVSFTARLDADDRLLDVVRAWQAVSDHHRRHPDL